MASGHDAINISKGPPVLYRLNTERKYIDGTNKKVRQWIYGRRDQTKQNKVILMVGETGAGKTTMINTIVNYLLGVKFENNEFYKITGEKREDQSNSQTSEITVYEVFVEENPTSLTIIDTPGYAHTEGIEKDMEISEYLLRLFSDEDGIHYIDAVCFVMKASQNRLAGKEFYIFHSVLSLFGKDIKNNIVFLLTQSPGGPPTDALNAIKTAGIPCRRDENDEPVHFLFNNQQEKRDKKYEQSLKSSWEMGDKSMTEFFSLLEENNRKSVQMTLDVLKKRERLEACVSKLVNQISEKEKKTEELNQIQDALRKYKKEIENCEKIEFKVNKVFKEHVPIGNLVWKRKVTCCSNCKENCHVWGCWWAKDPSKCWVMEKGWCTVCTQKCHHSEHVRESKKYVTHVREVTMTFDDLKKEYEDTDETTVSGFDKNLFENKKKQHESKVTESEKKSKIEQTLVCNLEKIKNEKSKQLEEAYVTIMDLSKIALKADSAFTLRFLDFLIPRLKEEAKNEAVKNLEDLKKAGEERKNKWAVQHLMIYGQQKWNAICSVVKWQK